jgi:hypothetical protein
MQLVLTVGQAEAAVRLVLIYRVVMELLVKDLTDIME